MPANVKKGDKWNFKRSGGKITLSGFYTVIYDPNDYPTVESEAVHASYEGIVPDYGSQLDVDGWEWLICKEKNVSQLAAHNFQVDITYTNAVGESGDQNMPRDPALMLPEISFFTVSNQEKIDRDKDGNAITNSAKEPPDPPISEDDMWMGMRVVKYYSKGEYDPNNYANYKRSTNSGTFSIKGKSGTYKFAGETVKFIEESMDEIEIGKETYSKVTRVFHIRADDLKWKRRILDEGYNVITGDNIKPAPSNEKAKRICTRELTNPDEPFDATTNPYVYTPTSEPTLLNGSGGVLAHDGTPVFLEKDVLTPKSYSGII